MTNAEYNMLDRDYTSLSFPSENDVDIRVVKLSNGSFAVVKRLYEQVNGQRVMSNGLNANSTENVISDNVVSVDFEKLSKERQEQVKNQVARVGKIIKFPTVEYRSVLEGKVKPAKLGSASVAKVAENGRLCAQVVTMKKDVTPEMKPVGTVKDKESANVVINFDPEEIKNRVNDSFENASQNEEQMEYSTVKEYKIDIPAEDEKEKNVRLPHANRSAKLNMPVDEKENNIINFRDYIQKNNEMSNTVSELAQNRMPVFAVDEMLRGGQMENMEELQYEIDSAQEQFENDGIVDDDLELQFRQLKEEMNRLAEEQKQADERARSLEQMNKEKAIARKELERVRLEQEKQEKVMARVRHEKEQSEKQRADIIKMHEAAIEATKKKLEAERTRIKNRTKTYEREYQRASEEANRSLSERVAIEEKIDMIETEIPTVKEQIENDREVIEFIRKRTETVRNMAKEVSTETESFTTNFDIADNSSEEDNRIPIHRNSKYKNTSIFEGSTPINYGDGEKVISFSKGRKAA